MNRISTSKTRATVMFNLPGQMRYTVQECEGQQDEKLRAAIQKAFRTFHEEWIKPQATPGEGAAKDGGK